MDETQTEHQLTEEQKRLLEVTRKAIARFRELAEESASAGLSVLAREYDFTAREMELRLELQIRTLRGQTWQ